MPRALDEISVPMLTNFPRITKLTKRTQQTPKTQSSSAQYNRKLKQILNLRRINHIGQVIFEKDKQDGRISAMGCRSNKIFDRILQQWMGR